jgi:hypothetical protein
VLERQSEHAHLDVFLHSVHAHIIILVLQWMRYVLILRSYDLPDAFAGLLGLASVARLVRGLILSLASKNLRRQPWPPAFVPRGVS